jgi:hypothetical protein
MTLEPSEEQSRAVIDAMAHAVGRISVMAKTGYSPESVTASLPTLLEVAWPLIRDMVLEEAAKACEELQLENGVRREGCYIAAHTVRVMKGKP